MFYPGQAVYLPETKRVGIYLGFVEDTKHPDDPYMYVYMYLGDGGTESTTDVFSAHDLRPISKTDKKSLTGQVTYRTPFQRSTFGNIYSDTAAIAAADEFLNELSSLLKAKWFKSKYEVDVTPDESSNNKN